MHTDIAVRPVQLETEQIKYIAGTNFVPAAYRGKLPEILACIATGRGLGIGDMESLRQIHIIDGKASLSAELMVKLARRAGHSIEGDFGEGAVTVRGKRADTEDEISVTWTIGMAERANLTNKDNWKKYPEAMLWARAVSQLCRMLFPDVLGGVSYTPEEAEWSDEERITDALTTAVPPDSDHPDDRNGDTAPVEETPPVLDGEYEQPPIAD